MSQAPVPESERRLLAQIRSHAFWGQCEDRTAHTAPARAAFAARFLAEADGDPVRAEHLRKAYFARLALKSAQARRKAKMVKAEAYGDDAGLAGGGPDVAA